MSTPLGYFDDMYARDPDPWGFATRWYEHRKHALTVACLPRRRYRSAFEPGCSIGTLTEHLAGRCDRLLAADAVRAAASAATDRLAAHPHVTVEQRRIPRDWPIGPFDLIVLSELGYYFDEPELDRILTHTVASLEPGGDLIAVHWRWPVAEHARTGDEVHAAIAARPELHRVSRHEEADFLLEVFTRVPPGARSVAQHEGLC